MSLNVPAALLEQAEHDDIGCEDFVACVQDSLPYAWTVISTVVADLHAADAPHAEHALPPPSETHRGQLLRALASDAIRTSLEQYFGVQLAFQNCHRIAAFTTTEAGRAAYRQFTTPRAQILNQTPQLRDC